MEANPPNSSAVLSPFFTPYNPLLESAVSFTKIHRAETGEKNMERFLSGL